MGAPEYTDASSTGVGKTLTNLATVLALPDVTNVLVIAPKSVLPNWRLHLRDVGTGGKRWCLINYESVKNLLTLPDSVRNASRQTTKNKRRVEDGQPRVQWDVVIRDEAHTLSNPVSQMSLTVDKLIAGRDGRAAFVLNLTATPGKDPSQLAYMYRGLMHSTGERPPARSNTEHYAQWAQSLGMNVRHSNYGNGLNWKYNADDIDTMRTILFGGDPPLLVRGRPDGWPQQERTPVPIEFDPNERAQYNSLWDEFLTRMHTLNRRWQVAQRSGNRRDLAQIRQQANEAQIRYRQKAGLLRVPHVADHVETLLAQGKQVAVSCEFTGTTVPALVEELEGRKIACAQHTGRNTSTREQERIDFQTGTKRVIVFTTVAGVNLHAGETAVDGTVTPRALVIAESRWSPRQMIQIEGRTHRNGEDAPAHYVYALDTVEERVIQRFLEGMTTTFDLMGDDTEAITTLAETMGVPLFEELETSEQ